jgi:hypothetical protein
VAITSECLDRRGGVGDGRPGGDEVLRKPLDVGIRGPPLLLAHHDGSIAVASVDASPATTSAARTTPPTCVLAPLLDALLAPVRRGALAGTSGEEASSE